MAINISHAKFLDSPPPEVKKLRTNNTIDCTKMCLSGPLIITYSDTGTIIKRNNSWINHMYLNLFRIASDLHFKFKKDIELIKRFIICQRSYAFFKKNAVNWNKQHSLHWLLFVVAVLFFFHFWILHKWNLMNKQKFLIKICYYHLPEKVDFCHVRILKLPDSR